MPDETVEDIGNESPLEGGEELFSAIDSVLSSTPEQSPPPDQQQTQEGQEQTAEQKAEAQRVEEQRQRDEQGKFLPKDTTKDDTQGKNGHRETQKPGDKQYPEEIKSVKARQHFDKVNQLRDEAESRASAAEAKAKQFETRIQELESKSGVAAPEVKVLQKQLADLQSQLDEKERVISYTAVQETKQFREGVTAPQNDAEDVMKQVVAAYSMDGRKLDDVLREPNKFKRAEMLADLTAELPERAAYVKSDLRDAVEKWVSAEGTAKKLLENAKGMKDYADQERQQAEATSALDRQQKFKTAEKDMLATIMPKFPELSGDKTMWDGIAEKASKVTDFDLMPPKAKAFANWSSWAIMPLMEKHRATLAELQREKEVNAARTKSLPGGGSSRGGAQITKEDEVDEADPLGGLFGQMDSVLTR